jgi:hypothetical protein
MTWNAPLPATRRAFLADTTALLLFFSTTGALNERFIAGMDWEQVLHARLLGAALMIPVARPYGMWRDWLMTHAGDSRSSRLVWDSLALVSFQVPIYALIIWISGASGQDLWVGVISATLLMIVLGRPYGWFLNLVRRLFGLAPGGTKPMSLGG